MLDVPLSCFLLHRWSGSWLVPHIGKHPAEVTWRLRTALVLSLVRSALERLRGQSAAFFHSLTAIDALTKAEDSAQDKHIEPCWPAQRCMLESWMRNFFLRDGGCCLRQAASHHEMTSDRMQRRAHIARTGDLCSSVKLRRRFLRPLLLLAQGPPQCMRVRSFRQLFCTCNCLPNMRSLVSAFAGQCY